MSALEVEQEEMKATIKGLEKENKAKETDISKKDKKIKEIEG